MGTKDITEKQLADYNDVFADILNVFLFKGARRVKPSELIPTKIKSQYKADDSTLHELEKDNAKAWRKNNVTFSMFGLENQSEYEKYMPLRIFGYEGASYRSQLLDDDFTKPYPVITLVLNFSMTRWSKAGMTLKDVVPASPELEPYMNDIKINVCDIAWLDDETVKLFQSDFQIVADFFVQMRKNGSYKPSRKKIKHVDEVLKLLSIFANSEEFNNLIKTGKSKGLKNMCEVTRKIKEDGINEGLSVGLSQGLSQGRNEERIHAIQNMIQKNYSKEAILDLDYTEEEYEIALNAL